MKYRLYDYSELILLTVGYFSVFLGAIAILGATIVECLYEGFSLAMVFANGLFWLAAGYIFFWVHREWDYYFALVSINGDGIKLANKTKTLFEGNWSELTKIFFLAQVIWGREAVAMFFSKDSTDIEPKELGKKWKMSNNFFHTVIEAAKIGEVLKYCPEEKIIWVLDKDCPPERFRKYGIYSYQYKL